MDQTFKDDLKTNIQKAIVCRDVFDLLKEYFINYFNTNILNFEYSNKTGNYVNNMNIFYRNGLSVIITKLISEAKDNKNELVKEFVSVLENKYAGNIPEFIEKLNRTDILFNIIKDDKLKAIVEHISDENKGIAFTSLYPQEKFNQLIQKIPEKDRDAYQKNYKKMLDIKKKTDLISKEQKPYLVGINKTKLLSVENPTNQMGGKTNTLLLSKKKRTTKKKKSK